MGAVTKTSGRYRRAKDVVLRRIAGETLLVPICNRLADLACVYVLHGSGEFLWERMDGTRSREDLVRELVDQYEVPESEAGADVDAFLAELAEAGLAGTDLAE